MSAFRTVGICTPIELTLSNVYNHKIFKKQATCLYTYFLRDLNFRPVASQFNTKPTCSHDLLL